MNRHLALIACGVLCASAAAAENLPSRKAGLWEMTMKFEQMPVQQQTTRQCIDAKTDSMMNANFGGMGQQSCSKRETHKTAKGFTVDSVCSFDGATTTTHAVFAGDLNSAYTVDVTSKRQGGPQPSRMAAGGETHMTISARWTGPCKAGMRPGDMIMPGGIKMNILDIQARRPGRPQQ